MTDPAHTERLAQAQLDAYNAHDIESFVQCYAPDVEVYDLGGPMRYSGLEELRRIYGDVFATKPELHAHLVGRLVVGDTAVDQERVVGMRPDGREVHALAIYKVVDGKIAKVWFRVASRD